MTKLQFHGRSIIITLLVMLLTVALGGYAQNASATASVDFGLTTAGNQTQTSLSGVFTANQIIKLEVRASGTSAIIAHQFRLSFDSTYFAFVSGSSSIDNGVVEENRLKNNGGSIFLNTFTSAVSTSGTTSTLLFGVTLDGASQTQAMSVSGEGLMGVVALRVKAAFVANPTSTNLTLVNAKFVHYTIVSNENALGTTYNITHSGIISPSAPTLQSPATDTVNQATTLTLSWGSVTGATSYRLQLATDSLFATVVVNDSTLTSASKQVGPLLNNTKYFWRVNAKNAAGTSSYSSVFNFTTIVSAPAIPVLQSPATGATNQATTLTLSWGSVTGVASYRLQLATDSLFANLVVNDSTLTSASKQVGPLLNNTKYYWRVNAKNAAGTSSYSSVFNFTTIVSAPAIPVLQSPATDATNQATTLTLSWGSVTGAASYRLQLASDSLFANLVVNDSTLTSASRQVGPLLNNTKYYWRVNAKNAAGTSSYSSVFNFTTIVSAPAIPVLQSPATGAVNQATTLTLSWGSVTGAASYRLQVATDSLFATVVFNDSTLTSASKQVGPLLNNTKYFWRVNAKNAAGTSSYSSIYNFTTIVSLPGVPVLTFPSNGAINRPTTLGLSWGSVTGAASYRLQVAKDSLFATVVFNDSTLTSASQQVGPLLNNTKYFWRVNSKNAAGTSSYSSVFNFKTIVAVPASPLLSSPLSGVTVSAVPLKFIWYAVVGAANYKLQISKDIAFSTIVYDSSSITDTSVVLRTFDDKTTYYWRVYAINAGGSSASSTVWNFKTLLTAIDEINNPLPTSYTLLQNYPNPFNPTTNIKFGVPENSSVKIVIYDIIGREVATLVNENYTPGYYTMPFNATTLASGMYIYRMTSQSLNGDQKLFTNTKKFMLLK